MKLEDEEIKLKNILLDENNPRFMTSPGSSQSELVEKITETEDAKELKASMKEEVRWVNRIVVRERGNLIEDKEEKSEFEKKEAIIDVNKDGEQGQKYVVVEGNMRTACLKSGEIDNYDEETRIPVLISKKESDESKEEYREGLRTIQGISNVMTVKEWDASSKARHVYNMFLDRQAKDDIDRPLDAVRSVANSLGLTTRDARNKIKRYNFYKEIKKWSDKIEKGRWSYLEAIDKNNTTRSFFGFDNDDYVFEWEKPEEKRSLSEEKLETKKSLLKDIPKIIDKAATGPKYTTGQFRDVFPKIFEMNNSFEERKEMFEKLVDGKVSWNKLESESDKEELCKKLKKAQNTIKEIPTLEDWASELKDDLNKVRELANKQLEMIENVDEDND